VRQTSDGRPAPAGAAGFRFALVVARFNDGITSKLSNGARTALVAAGAAATDIEEFAVPGAYEIPQAARAVAETGRFDAVVALGCVIRGETPHFDYICAAAAHGLMAAAGDTGVPMAFGVLTTDTEAQAAARAGDGPGNKGIEAAAAAIDMARLFRTLREDARSPFPVDANKRGAARGLAEAESGGGEAPPIKS
jgi:6,7-dimethyl-8-ribityllumazine synthase